MKRVYRKINVDTYAELVGFEDILRGALERLRKIDRNKLSIVDDINVSLTMIDIHDLLDLM